MRPFLGPTGDFPQGKLNPTDEGGLQVMIGNKDGAVIITFGTPVAWFGMPNSEAIDFAKKIMKQAGVKSVKVIL